MKIKLRLLAIPAAILSLGGCISQQLVDETRKSLDDSRAMVLKEHQAVSEKATGVQGRRFADQNVNKPYIAGKAVPLSKEVTLPPALRRGFDTVAAFKDSRTVTLAQAAERITLATRIPVVVTPDVYLTGSALLPKGQGGAVTNDASPTVGGQAGAMPPPSPTGVPVAGAALPSPLVGVGANGGTLASISPQMMMVDIPPGQFQLSSFLDGLATRLGINWKYDDGKGAIVLYRMVTTTWQIPGAPTNLSFTTAFQGSTSQSTNSTSLSSQQQSNGQASSKFDAQNVQVLEGLKNSLQTVMTRSGSIYADQANGTITLTDTRDSVDRAELIVQMAVKKLSRRITLKVRTVQVTTNNASEAGIDWNIVITKALQSVPGFSIKSAAPASLTSGDAGQIGLTIMSGAFSGTQAIVNALRTLGDVDSSTEIPLQTRNRQPISYNVSNTFSYVSNTTPATSTVGGTGGVPGITTSQDSVGLKLVIYPDATDRETVDLTFSIEDSTLNGPLQTFTSGKGDNQQSVQLVNKTIQGGTQDVLLRNGSTIVLTGFDKKEDQLQRRTLFDGAPLITGGSSTVSRKRTTTVVLLSASVEDGI